jgi:hypothetical protein
MDKYKEQQKPVISTEVTAGGVVERSIHETGNYER